MNQKISILLCTYNGENLVSPCLDSILSQTYKNFEVLCIDGMSQDKTQEIIKDYARKDKRIRLIVNKNRLPEGPGNGKWLGFRKSKGEIVGIIDQDNIIQRRYLFNNVIKIMKKKQNLLGILGGLTHDKNDSKVVRYVSLFGTDSFFSYRSMDFIRNLSQNKSKNEVFYLNRDNMPLTGGNCFFYNKRDVSAVGGYNQDVLVVKNLVENSKNKLVIINNATKHYAERDIFSLVRKKFMWGGKYFIKEDTERFDYLPRTQKERIAFSKNFIFNILIIPNLFYSFKIYNKSRDLVAFLFPFMAFLNTIAYGLNFLKQKLFFT